MIRGFLIDAENRTANVVEIDGSLESYYKLIKCDTFDIATRRIGKRYYCIYCDDVGLLKCDPIVSALDSKRHPMRVGNLIITSSNGDGETISLTDEEIEEVKSHLSGYFTEDGKCHPCVVCDY